MGKLNVVADECCVMKLNQINELEVGGRLKFRLK